MTVVSGGFSVDGTPGKMSVVESVADETLAGWDVVRRQLQVDREGHAARRRAVRPARRGGGRAGPRSASKKMRHAVRLRQTRRFGASSRGCAEAQLSS